MTAFGPSPQVKIGDIVVDASLTEAHVYDAEATEYPVEQGADVTDNVRAKPIEVTIEGLVSDTPLGRAAAARASSSSLPSEDVLAGLLAIRDARQPVTIQTSLRSFPSMVLVHLEIPRDPTTGYALKFSATFRQVILVVNARVTVPVKSTATPGGQGKRDLGAKACKEKMGSNSVTLVVTMSVKDRATANLLGLGDPVPSTDQATYLHFRQPTSGFTPDGTVNDAGVYKSFGTTKIQNVNFASGAWRQQGKQWVGPNGQPIVSGPPPADADIAKYAGGS